MRTGNRDILDRNADGWLPHGVRNFSIRHSVGDGTYYFRVQGQRGSTGAYRVHARLVTLPGATAATAQTVTLGEPALGRIQLVRHLSEDNYFTFTLTATTDVAIMASGFVDVIGELRDSGQTVLGSENGSGFLGADGFLLRRSLPADTYYVRVRARAYNGAGPYVLLIDEAGDAGGSSSVAATPLPFGHPQVARISSDTEEDYYRFTLDAETYVRFLAQPLRGLLRPRGDDLRRPEHRSQRVHRRPRRLRAARGALCRRHPREAGGGDVHPAHQGPLG